MTDLDKTLDSIYRGDMSRSEIKQEILQWAEAERKKYELQARISERKKIALDYYRGKTVSESTNWKAMFEHFMEGNELAIKDMERESR